MLGNERPPWEAMLAAMKLGAVVVPATTLLVHEDLVDRFARGNVKHVIAGAWSCFFAPRNAGACVFIEERSAATS